MSGIGLNESEAARRTQSSERPLPPARTRSADLIQRPCARAVSIKGMVDPAGAGPPMGATVSATPTLPTAWLLKTSAADVNQLRRARVVA